MNCERWESLSRKISTEKLSTECLPSLESEAIEYIEEIEELLGQDTDLARLVAFNRVSSLAGKKKINPSDIEETRKLIAEDISRFGTLIRQAPAMEKKGGEAHGNVQVVA